MIKRFLKCAVAALIIITSIPVFAEDIYANRGEVADMLLNAADFYNEGVSRSDIIKGYSDGQLHEDWNVTRAEALVMLKRAFGNLPEPVGHNARVALVSENFNDIPQWAEAELQPLFDCGLVAGVEEGVFSPDSYVTKRQMELFINRVYALYATNVKDDFYATVNKETLETIKLPSGSATTGVFDMLQQTTSKQINKIINEAVSGKYAAGTPRRKIADFYSTITDTEKRNKDGVKPIKPYLESIDKVNNIGELTLLHHTLSQELCTEAFLGFSLTVDLENSSKYMLCFNVRRPYMNKEVYTNDSTQINAYREYIESLLILSGEDEKTAAKNAKSFIAFETKLAENMLDAGEVNEIEKVYNVYSYNKICAMFPDFDMEQVLKGCSLKKDNKILVTDIRLTETFADMYNQSNIDVLKTAMKIAVISMWGETLNEDFAHAREKLDSEIFGIKSEYTQKDYAVQILTEVMPEYIGQIYVEKYFDEKSRADVERMAYDIIEVFKKRIASLLWMSESTKEIAVRKLDAINVKIGYPDEFKTYIDDVEILPSNKGGTYFNNMLSVTRAAVNHQGMMEGMEHDRNGWIIYPHTINACYDSSANDITFPAALLQAPLYDKNASYEENLGGIGYIIAHEITHAFDSSGAKFDENGNIENWWSNEDYRAFADLCDKAVDFFDGYEAISAVPNNGLLTLNENIADLGAVACITQLGKEKDNFDYKRLYTSMAKAWVNTRTREYAKYAMLTDFHSDPKVRINRVLVNYEEFYEAFGIEEGDGMYVPIEQRLTIW